MTTLIHTIFRKTALGGGVPARVHPVAARTARNLTTTEGPAVIPSERPDGTWTLYICGLGRFVGKYPTRADAYRAAQRSGYRIGEEQK